MGKIAAIDFGLKRIGIAISDVNQKMALPWITVEGDLASVVKTLMSRRGEIEKIVMGLPLLMNGQKSDMAEKVEAFAKELEKALQIEIVLIDERLSSKQADRALKDALYTRKERKGQIDQMAAALLLDQYITTQSMRQ